MSQRGAFGRRCALTGLLIAAALPAPAPGAAQECPTGGAWPTTQFDVRVRRATGDLLEAALNRPRVARRMAKQLLESFPEDPPEVDAEWERVLEGHLEDAARRLQSAGFRCPLIRTEVVDGEPRYVAYLIRFDEDPQQSWLEEARGRAYTAMSDPDDPYFLLDRESFLEDVVTGEKVHHYWTAAHELFHMIQGTYDLEFGSIGMQHEGGGRDFVVEGGASGVATYLVSQRFPGHLENRETGRKYLGGFLYLQNFLESDKDSKFMNAYETGSLWFHLAERFGLPVIEALLRRPLQAVSKELRLRWLDGGLRADPRVGLPLSRVFTHFLTEVASYGPARRYGAVKPAEFREVEDQWLHWILDECEDRLGDAPTPIPMRPDGGEKPYRSFPADEMEGRCFRIEWTGYPENAQLQVQVNAPEQELVRQIHLGLADASFRPYRNCWNDRRGASCVLEPSDTLFRHEDRWYKTWDVPPAGYGAEGEALFALTNVDPRSPWDTRPAPDLEIQFHMLHEQASMAAGGGGGPSGAAVAAPLEIELDEVRQDFVFPTAPLPTQAHIPDACSIRFWMTNSETKEAVFLHMDHSGPIAPGRYAISRRERPSYAPPEDHPDTFTAAFSVDMGGEKPYDFWYHSGTVTITSIAGRLVKGEVRANGWRRSRGSEPSNASIVARFTLVANRHTAPTRREKETGQMALRCLEQSGPPAGGVPPPPAPEPEKPEDPTPEPDEPEETGETDEEDEDEGRPVPPVAPAPAEAPAETPADPSAGPERAEATDEGRTVRTARVAVEFRGDVRSMVGRAERRAGPSETTLTIEGLLMTLSLPRSAAASCDLSGAPAGIAEIVGGKGFRAEALRIRMVPAGFEMEVETGDEDGTLVVRGRAVESVETRRRARSLHTRHDVRDAALEIRWPGGSAACVEPIHVSFLVLETL